MNPQMMILLARARQQELRDSAVKASRAASAREPRWASVAVRLATAADRTVLERLADLDSASAPTGHALIGSISDRPVAALSLADGRVLADPFTPTCDVVELLRLRARQLRVS